MNPWFYLPDDPPEPVPWSLPDFGIPLEELLPPLALIGSLLLLAVILRRKFRKRRRRRASPLEDALLEFGPGEPFTVRESFQHVAILGGTGSGKTTSLARMLAISMMRAGYGMFVLCFKSDEAARFRRYAREAGREGDILEITPDGPYRLNFLAYALHHGPRGTSDVENVARLWTALHEIHERRRGGHGSSDPFWDRAQQRLFKACLGAVRWSGEPVTIPNLYRVATSAPKTLDIANDPKWQESTYCGQVLAKADAAPKTPEELEDWRWDYGYLRYEYPNIPDRTQGSILETFASLAEGFLRGKIRNLFCTDTTITPQMCWKQRKIVLAHIPVAEHGDVAQSCQVGLKYIFQKAVLARDVALDPCPFCLWMDEAPAFLTPQSDMPFLATARQARAAFVLIAQGISGMYAVAPRETGKAEADSILGNCATKVFFNNADPVTNQWAADLIGQQKRMFWGGHANYGRDGEGQASASFNEQMAYPVLPTEFTTLMPGGQGLAEAIVFQSGRAFRSTGKPYTRVLFPQG